MILVMVVVTACTNGGSTAGRTTTTTPSDAVTAGGLAPAVTPKGTIRHETMTVAGRERTYRLYLPSDLPRGPVPLLIGLHGGNSSGDQFARTDKIEGLAESNGFIAAHPDGVKTPGQSGGHWIGGLCCAVGSAAARENVDDVGFIDALVTAIEREHELDADRIYAFGYSNGAAMAYRLACEFADRVAAVGLYAGTLGIDTCAPAMPVSVLHIHGDADLSLPIDGGIGPASVAGVHFPSPRAGFETLATMNRCPEAAVTTDGARRVDVRKPCARGTTLEFVTISGADHRWDGAGPGFDTTAEIVEFLLAHPRTR